ncbi:extracellular solute-binding protein [Modestobacter sp. VKM Ac-2979]|uniref:ABC transporter substrate-binding protein n=1 Tax=unclassified Modestobacter TaxID=2643866 RepID=UPI0022ABC1E7|nr:MULTISPECIES: extracellular solute-binding protein [unclassified Modestobacter]MCZ2813515.1 extracellular solute-binding protein [Modestobacter sp. VKM Ac-2979]MCZ2842293.1 extracellular solute-binding protein [Modestobacter sp. VKM Ac-2980]
MFHSSKSRAAWGAALAAVLLTAGCGGSDDASADAADYDPDAPVTLTVGTFGTMDLDNAGLYDEYMELHPNVTIKQNNVAQSAAYYKSLQTRLAANSGLDDVQALEIGFIADVVRNHADAFVDFAAEENADELEGNFYDWKWGQASTSDGETIALGTDTGPQAMCYRKDLFEQAGLPTDRAEVADLWPTWEAYLEVAEQYMASPTKPADSAFVDSPASIFSSSVYQGDLAYNDEEGNPIPAESDGVQQAWDYASQAADEGLTANLSQFGDEWNAAFSNGAFATIACPAWMLGYINSQMGETGAGLWDIAPLPGSDESASNWGGSFLGVPADGPNAEAAKDLVEWLTAPEQQVKMFTRAAHFPSSPQAAEDPEVVGATNEYFGSAPTGEIFGESAANIQRTPIGPYDTQIQEAFTTALTDIASGGADPAEGWDNALKAAQQATGG